MKIFLDIDGVMLPANPWRRPEFLADGFPVFSSKAVQALQRILSETGAEIILTTSHKSNYSIQDWLNIFEARGIAIRQLERLPENANHLSRKAELVQWFNIQVPDNFIIIDDDKSLNDLPHFLKERLILTSSGIGLTAELANEAINRLQSNKIVVA